MAHEVFICYANQDKTVAEAVCSKLEDSGIRCWLAPRDVTPGQNFAEAIMGAVAQSRIMVLVFSINSNDSEYCINEVHTAFNRRTKIIPLMIDATIPSGDMEFYLQRKQWFDAQKPPLEQHLQRLVDEVKAHLAQAAAREEAAARAKKEAEEAKKAQEAARAKREAEETAREKARQEAETARARKEAEVGAKEKAQREAEATRVKKEAEEAAKEKARWEEEAARARQEAEEAKKAREAALKAKKEAEESRKERARQEAETAKVRRETEKAVKTLEKRKAGRGRGVWLSAGIILSLAGIVVAWGFALIWSGAFGFPVVNEPWRPLYPQLTLILVFSLPGVIPGVLLIRRGITGYLQNKPISRKASRWWWFLPVALGFIGGIISWFANKNVNWYQARNMLTLGILLTLVFTTIPLIPGVPIVPPPEQPGITAPETTPSQAPPPVISSPPSSTPTPTLASATATTPALTTAPAPKPTPAPTTAPTPTPTTLTPRYGGILKEITTFSPTNLAPSWMSGIPQNTAVRTPCIETLLHLDESGNPVTWLATGWQYSSDMKSLTFNLRKGVKFHDGTDFNATTVKYCLDKYRTSTYSELKTVTSIDVTGDYTVRLNLSEFQAYFLLNFAKVPGEIVSSTCIEAHKIDEQWLNANLAAGTGPFKFVSYQPDVKIKYTKFDGYWQKGKPYLDSIETYIFADKTAALTAFKSGQVDTINITPNFAVDLQKEGKYIITCPPVSALGIAGDSVNPQSPFANVRVRRAVAYAIDNTAILEAFGHGIFRVSNQPVIPESWAYNKDVVGYSYNPQKAKQLLAEAGYPSGFKTKLIYNSTDPASPASLLFPAIQGYLKAVGIDAELQGLSNALFQQAATDGWTNALIQCPILAGIDIDPGKALRDVLSSQAGSFVSVLHPADYEAMLAKSIAEFDFEKRKALTQLTIKMAVDDYCLQNTILIVPAVRASYPTVHDMRRGEIWVTQWTPEDAWLSG